MKTRTPVAAGMGKQAGGGAVPGDHPVTTIEILHRHNVSATTKEKIVIPVVLLALGAVLLGGGVVLWDHKNHEYRTVASFGDLVAAAQEPPAKAGGGLGAWLRPSDAQFVEVAVLGWQFWNGKNAVTQEHYLRLPDLRAGSVEALVKGDKVAETVVFRFDLSRSEPPRYFVETILRGGVPAGESGLIAEVLPVTMGSRPAVGGEGYRQADGFVYDQDGTFRGTTRFAARGRLQSGERGLWLQSRGFNVAIESGLAPGLAALLTDLANTTLSEQATYFLDLRETFPMREGAAPGRRAVSHEIGLARLDGVALGKFYFTNVADPGSSATASR